ncbi:MAG: DUF167 domain-containing protein [Bryobacteraceae bacterium]
MARITVKVHPGARRTRVVGRLGEAYKLDVAAPPAEGKANEACLRLVAALAGVSAADVRIITGRAGRTKVIEIRGVTQEMIEGKMLA